MVRDAGDRRFLSWRASRSASAIGTIEASPKRSCAAGRLAGQSNRPKKCLRRHGRLTLGKRKCAAERA